ncbi:hypothetical protein [Roseivivax sp.]
MDGDTDLQFVSVAQGGLGHEGSTLAHAMAWFQDHLYLGTTAPRGASPTDAGRILRFDPKSESWETAHSAPVIETNEEILARLDAQNETLGGKDLAGLTGVTHPTGLAREYGIRALQIFKGKSDPHPCLYAGTMSLFGGGILRSEDGVSFEPVLGTGRHDDRILSFRGLVEFKGRLYTAPAGTATRDKADPNFAPEAMVYVSDDPAKGAESWAPVCEPAFGDPVNRSVFALGVAHGYLYAGTASWTRGFQLWRTDGKGKGLHKWERVLTDGAYRFNHNFSVATLCAFDGDMYVGSGISGLGYDKAHDVGPATAELIRVKPDGSWDLLVGDLRCTPDGLKVPLSAMGPGFDDPYNSVMWSMTVHEDALYVGTQQWEPFDTALHGDGSPLTGGYQLWRSRNGSDWEKVIDAALGRVSATGLRSMQSTPAGLFLGTSVHPKLLRILSRKSGAVTPALNADKNGFEVLRGS